MSRPNISKQDAVKNLNSAIRSGAPTTEQIEPILFYLREEYEKTLHDDFLVDPSAYGYRKQDEVDEFICSKETRKIIDRYVNKNLQKKITEFSKYGIKLDEIIIQRLGNYVKRLDDKAADKERKLKEKKLLQEIEASCRTGEKRLERHLGKRAERYFREGLEKLEKVSKYPEIIKANLLRGLGFALELQECFPEAKECLTSALDSFRGIPQGEPQIEIVTYHLSIINERISADLSTESGDRKRIKMK